MDDDIVEVINPTNERGERVVKRTPPEWQVRNRKNQHPSMNSISVILLGISYLQFADVVRKELIHPVYLPKKTATGVKVNGANEVEVDLNAQRERVRRF